MTKQQETRQLLEEGMRQHRAGEMDHAIAIYRDILEIDSRHHDAHHLLGLALHQTGHDDEAIPLFERAIMLQPSNPACLANFAELWRKQGKHEKAVECYLKVLQIKPSDHIIRQLLGEAWLKRNRPEAALVEFEKVILGGHASANTWCGIFEANVCLGHFEDALSASIRATQIDPNSEVTWHTLARNLLLLGRVRESLPAIERAIKVAPDERILYWWRGWILMLLGDFDRGWIDYESRWDVEELQLKDRRPFPGWLWRGQELEGKTVFVHLEQGAGDTFQFIRYLPLLQERAAKVILECHDDIQQMVDRSIPGLEFWKGGKIPYDFHVPLASLPLAFKTTLANIPAKVPYLRSDPALVQAWQTRVAESPGLKVGLAWAGKPSHKNDHQRSMALKLFSPLAEIAGVQFVSLQKGKAVEQIAETPSMKLLDWTAELNNYDDTAALIESLDLVISVDTSVAHLAGALGKPVWTLLPFTPDFRWLLERSDSPWYPTMRLFRQPAFKNWEAVVKTVAGELARLAANPSYKPSVSPICS